MSKAAAAVSQKGHSDSWLAQQRNIVRIFNDEYQCGTEWGELTEAQVTDTSLYESFASSLLYEHKRNTVGGALEFLKGSNVCNYVYIIINLAKNKFNAKSTNAATKPLFTCVGAGASTPAAILLRGIKKDTVRVTFEREKEAGTASDANGKVCKSDIMHVRMKPNNFRFRCSSALLQNGKTFSASIVDNN
jgi:hypothetical protein